AGAGLGRSHALQLAARGAQIVVNDLGDTKAVVDEIIAAGGQAIGFSGSVTDADAMNRMVEQTMAQWGRIDILVNNAGILRDKSFSKMTLDDFRLVVDVHLMGAVICTKADLHQSRLGDHEDAAIWPHHLHHLVIGPVWQLRTIQLRRGQNGAGGLDADLVP
ncbi:MAG: hypothetical protein RLZZ369_1038, partial [Pseudomonadota bacterium]